MSHTPPSPGQIQALVDAAEHLGALIVPVDDAAVRDPPALVLADAARRQAFVPGYVAEVRMWSGRYAAAGTAPPRGLTCHPAPPGSRSGA